MAQKRTKHMTHTIPLPTRHKDSRKTVTTTLDKALLEALEPEMAKRGLRLCDVLEWGMKRFLLDANPQAAKKFGIITDN
jgi:hypothetical protein